MNQRQAIIEAYQTILELRRQELDTLRQSRRVHYGREVLVSLRNPFKLLSIIKKGIWHDDPRGS